MLGTTVSHYRIVRELGAGGMGVVYEAEDTRLRRNVALKFLSSALAQDAPMLERFEREARAASALSHPGICTVHAIEQDAGRSFIVMELVEGESLATRLAAGPMPIGQLVDIGIQMADALEAAHAKGIVHRDLKPMNMMVTARGQVKILDFGLAKFEGPGGASAQTTSPTAPPPPDLTAVGTVFGTVHYMSPEQARGMATDARTDLFSLGAILYQMATGDRAFEGDTQAVVFDAILNRDPRPLEDANPAMPASLGPILEKALEKNRDLRYQTATDLKTDLLRLRRKLEGSRSGPAAVSDSKAPARGPERSIAVLYFENISGVKEDEYLRDGVTEDIITELSKIRALKIFSRPTVLAYRDKAVTPAQIGKQLGAAYVLAGSLRRAGVRLRINAQLIDTLTDFPVWSERYDREMQDVFELQDEIARKIAEALRITLTRQEEEALAAKPTENLQAYDLYLRGKSYIRRLTRQDFEFGLQMFENAVSIDPNFALAHAGIANACAQYHYHYEREKKWIDRAVAASQRASALSKNTPEVLVAEGWILYAEGKYDQASRCVRQAIDRKADSEGAYYLLGRTLFAAGRYQEVVDLADDAIAASGEDYNIYVPILNALGALGKGELRRRFVQSRMQFFETHLGKVPEDARARALLANDYAESGRPEDAMREVTLAMALRPNEATVLYNAACLFCNLNRRTEAMDALKRAWEAGFKDPSWTRGDPDLASLHGDPEFERLYPAPKEEN